MVEDIDETRILKVFDNLYEMNKNGVLCDAVLRTTSGSEFQVHSPLISATIPNLKSFFSQGNVKSITIPEVSRGQLQAIVEYAYTGKTSATKENVGDLLQVASLFQINGMVQDCCHFLATSLTVENCIGILNYAQAHSHKELEEDAYNFLLYHFEEVAKRSDELLQLPANEIFKLLHDTNLNCRSEECVWEAILRWIYHNTESRKCYLPSLLSCVRTGLISDRYFDQYIKRHPLVISEEQCEPLLSSRTTFFDDVKKYGQRSSETSNEEVSQDDQVLGQSRVTPLLAQPRMTHDILFVIGGWATGQPTNAMETYDIRDNTWVKNVRTADPEGPRAYHKLAVINDFIYVIGGFDGRTYFNSCRRYNYLSKEWQDIAPMNHRRCYVSVAVLDDVIYALGGHDGHHRLSTAEKYDYKRNQWTMISPMQFRRSDAAATAFRERIYIFGGFSGTEVLNSAECYDPEVNEWSMIAFMTSPRSGVSCVSYHNSIYVIGGFDGTSRLRNGEIYCHKTNSWRRIPELMTKTRSNFAIEVIDDEIYVIGGFDGTTTISDVECFNDMTRIWQTKASLNMHKSALAACVIKALPNARDYVHENRSDRTFAGRRQNTNRNQVSLWGFTIPGNAGVIFGNNMVHIDQEEDIEIDQQELVIGPIELDANIEENWAAEDNAEQEDLDG